MQRVLVLALALGLAHADFYLHGPRGSNNRLNEQSANRDDANRMFDSQNNNRGGYNVGDRTTTAFSAGTPVADVDSTQTYTEGSLNGNNVQYQMVYHETSILNIEWTNQHGCGGNPTTAPHQLNCQITFQYSCDTKPTGYNNNGDYAMTMLMKDGASTTQSNNQGWVAPSSVTDQGGRHESDAYYYECQHRTRNQGLFLADQNLNGNTAIYTRQNPNGDRSGLQCSEERDYYPYWHPSPWVDVAHFTNEDLATRCAYVQQYSQNSNNQVGKCTTNNPNSNPPSNTILAANNPTACGTAGGVYAYYSWGLAPPICQQVNWTRSNHLGNGVGGQMLQINWTVPAWTTLDKYFQSYGASNNYKKCVWRGRYNLTTDDYDPWNTDASSNKNANTGVTSPVTNNPTVDVGADMQGLRLAINTNQFGRTFQDRSHIFYIKQLPAQWATGYTIYNLNVRGKRGNIVETYPAIEYDFQPNKLHLLNGQDPSKLSNILVHVQWTGSNTHNNGDPGGDGQTGDAGQGTEGTDRHNFVQYAAESGNFPIPLDKFSNNMWYNTKCYNPDGSTMSTMTPPGGSGNMALDCAVTMATSGQYRSASTAQSGIGNWDVLLDNAPPSLIGGVFLNFNPAIMQTLPANSKQINYLCTRNNNFSNRSQKGVLLFS